MRGLSTGTALRRGCGARSVQLAHQLGFSHHHAIHGGLSMHLRDAGLAPGHFHLDAQLIAGPHRPRNFASSMEASSTSLFLRSGMLTSRPARPPPAPSLPPPARPASPGKSGKMAGEIRLVHCDVLDADDAILFQFDDGIHQQHRIAMRQNVANRLDVQEGHGNWLL